MAESRSLTPATALVAASAVLVGACAGGPVLDPAAAEALATRADVLASALAADDACAALAAGGDLVGAAAAARDRGEVPPEVAGEVIATTRDTVRGLTCEPPAPAPSPEPAPEPAPEPEPAPPDDDDTDDDDDDKPGKGKGRDRGRGD